MDKASLHTFMFRLAFSSYIFGYSRHQSWVSPYASRHVMWQRVFRVQECKFKVWRLIYWTGHSAILCALALGLALYIFATKCSSPIKGETALHCCDPASPVLVMLESRNVFYVVSAFQSIVCLSTKSVLDLFSFILSAYLRGGSRIILRRGAPLRNGVTGRGGSPPAPSP